nr:Probable signal peptidase complex subunit 2 [Hymenolepis microstoma]
MGKDVASAACTEITINKWDVNAAKHALDDATKEVMKTQLELQENFKLIDIRLLLCTLSVFFTLVALIYDYVCPYPESRYVLMGCIASYFVATTILSWHTFYVEGNIFFVGMQPDKAGLDPPNKWTFASKIKKYSPEYRLTVTYLDGTTKEQTKMEFVKTIDCFFDEKGKICFLKLQNYVLDICNAVTSKKKE